MFVNSLLLVRNELLQIRFQFSVMNEEMTRKLNNELFKATNKRVRFYNNNELQLSS